MAQKAALVTVLLTLAMLGGTVASAQVTVDRFVPAALASDGIMLARPTRTGHMQLGGLLYIGYAKNPVMWEVREHTTRDGTYALVSDQLVVYPNVSLGIADRWLVFARLPINAVVAGNQLARTATSIGYDEGGSLGALSVGGRYTFYDEPGKPLSLGVQVGIGVPIARAFGATSAFGSESGLTGTGQVLAEYRFGRARIDLNAGVRLRSDVVVVDSLRLGNEFAASIGGSYPLFDQHASRLEAIVEGFGSMLFSSFGGREQSPLEALAGVKWFREEGITAGVAGTLGVTAGYGSPSYRLVGLVGYSPVASKNRPDEEEDSDADGVPDTRDRCPHEPDDDLKNPKRDGCPDQDPDHDGVLASADRCPKVAEDLDHFQDTDGCPDPDNDKDGIPDSADKCPDEAEDRDQFEDTDGCPDPDNDADSVLDAADRCPTEAEDLDGFEDSDGCPDPDNDRDGVLDVNDNCPLEPQTTTGRENGDGCPNIVRIDKATSTLKGLDPIRFKTGTAVIHPESYETLMNVVTFMKDHPDAKHVAIEGHTDSQGNPKRNQKLSSDRAESVRKFLLEAGIVADRLSAGGYGQDVPVADNNTVEGRALNRRVEFRVATTD